mgnify:FL=1|jgi:ribosome-associated protein
MTKQKFSLTEGYDHIQLDHLLKILGIVSSGGEAHQVIEEGLVKVNSDVELRKRKKLRPGDTIQFETTSVTIE